MFAALVNLPRLGPLWTPGGVHGTQRCILGRPEQVYLQPAAFP